MGSTDARCQRIAGIDRHVHHTAALHAILGTPGPGGKDLTLGITVFVRVGVNDATDRAMLRCDFRFDTAPGASITRDHDRAFYCHAQAVELFVIFGNAVVHIDQRRRHVTVD